MSVEKTKMTEFVSRLWTNPALAGAPVARKENQILSFIRDNQSQLQAAFAQPNYFPALGWDGSVRLLLSVLTDVIVDSVEPRLDKLLDGILSPDVLGHLDIAPGEIDRERLRDFILKSLRNKAMRDPYALVFDTIALGLFERYVPKILDRRKIIQNDLYRKDRLSLPAPILIDYLQLCALTRPLFFYKVSASNNQLNLAAVVKDQKMYQATYKSLSQVVAEEVGGLPEKVLRSGVESCLNAEEHTGTSAAARLIGIMVARAADFDPGQQQDRGAETPDKSWFHIHRKTARYYGYDARYLDELYQIAGEEGW